ncbi:FAD dependent oxidoreductase [Aureococcus anophagefferens]|uniref:FAD dependent oxidoreductase n=1 Tax=Aureococcus anophagefferens TaxID=44056 RepID=A0ABR1G336_AURAN
MASWAHPSSCADIAVDTDDESVEPCEPHAALDLGDDASPRMYESADFGDLEQVGGRDPVPIFNASSQWRRQVTSAKLAEGGRRPERRGSDPFHFMGEDSDDGDSEGGGDPALQSTEAMMRLMMCVGGEEGKTYDEVVSHHYRPCELTPADALYDEIEELKKQVAALDEPRRRGDALPWQQGDDHCAVPGCTGASPDEGRRKRAPPHVCEDFEEDDFPEPPARDAAPAANRGGDRLFALSEVLELHVYAFLDGASLARFETSFRGARARCAPRWPRLFAARFGGETVAGGRTAYGAGCRDLGNALAWAPLDVDCDGVSLGRGSVAVAFRWSDGQPFGCAIHGGGDGILVLEDCFRAGAETLRGGKLARGSMGPRSHVDLRSLRRGGSSTHALLVHGGLVDLARTALAYVVCRDELEGEVYVTAREVRPHADMWPTVHHSLDVLGGPRGEAAVKLGGQRFDGEPVPDCFALALDGLGHPAAGDGWVAVGDGGPVPPALLPLHLRRGRLAVVAGGLRLDAPGGTLTDVWVLDAGSLSEPAAWAWSRCAVDPAAVRRARRGATTTARGAAGQRLDLYLATGGVSGGVARFIGRRRPARAGDRARAVLVDAPPAPEAGDERHAKRRFDAAFFRGQGQLAQWSASMELNRKERRRLAAEAAKAAEAEEAAEAKAAEAKAAADAKAAAEAKAAADAKAAAPAPEAPAPEARTAASKPAIAGPECTSRIVMELNRKERRKLAAEAAKAAAAEEAAAVEEAAKAAKAAAPAPEAPAPEARAAASKPAIAGPECTTAEIVTRTRRLSTVAECDTLGVVCVVGAGPLGSAAARHLLELGAASGCGAACVDGAAGWIDPDAMIRAQLAAAARAHPGKLEVLAGVAVEVSQTWEGVRVATDAGEDVLADRCVICAGAHTRTLAGGLDGVVVSRRTVALLEVSEATAAELSRSMPTIKYCFEPAVADGGGADEQSRVEAASVYVLPPVRYEDLGGGWFVKVGGGPNDPMAEDPGSEAIDAWLATEGDAATADWLAGVGRELLAGVAFVGDGHRSKACVTTIGGTDVRVAFAVPRRRVAAVSLCCGKAAGPADAIGREIAAAVAVASRLEDAGVSKPAAAAASRVPDEGASKPAE